MEKYSKARLVEILITLFLTLKDDALIVLCDTLYNSLDVVLHFYLIFSLFILRLLLNRTKRQEFLVLKNELALVLLGLDYLRNLLEYSFNGIAFAQ